MSTFLDRKQQRKEAHREQAQCVTVDCVACSGSGRYDDCGNPPCGACDGSGKNRVTLAYAIALVPFYQQREKSLIEPIEGEGYAFREERELAKVRKFLNMVKKKKDMPTTVA